MPTEPATLARAAAPARHSTPAKATRRAPYRSASIPAGAPETNHAKAAAENTSATSAREAPNSAWKAVKNAAKEYAAPKPTNIRVKAAATTIQPCDGRLKRFSW